jgi:hypothetical protein
MDYAVTFREVEFLGLRLIPDPLRADPRFQKLCEEKQP